MNDTEITCIAESIINEADKQGIKLQPGFYIHLGRHAACAVGVLWIETQGSYEACRAIYDTESAWYDHMWADLDTTYHEDFLTGLSNGYENQIAHQYPEDADEYARGYAVGQRLIELQEQASADANQ